MNASTRILLPDSSSVLRRLPLYVNMIANGYFYYWIISADQIVFPAADATNYMSLAFIVGTVSWYIALLMLRSHGFGRRDDGTSLVALRLEAAYLALAAIATFAWFMTQPLVPSPS